MLASESGFQSWWATSRTLRLIVFLVNNKTKHKPKGHPASQTFVSASVDARSRTWFFHLSVSPLSHSCVLCVRGEVPSYPHEKIPQTLIMACWRVRADFEVAATNNCASSCFLVNIKASIKLRDKSRTEGTTSAEERRWSPWKDLAHTHMHTHIHSYSQFLESSITLCAFYQNYPSRLNQDHHYNLPCLEGSKLNKSLHTLFLLQYDEYAPQHT